MGVPLWNLVSEENSGSSHPAQGPKLAYRRGHGHQVNEKRDVCGPSTMAEMPDDVLTELITAIVAARADGDGVLTIAAVRARLEAAKLYVARVEDERTGSEDFSVLAS